MNKPTQTLTSTLLLEIKAEMVRKRVEPVDLATDGALSIHQVSRRLSGGVELTVADSVQFARALRVPLWVLMRRAEERLEAA